MKHVVIVGGGIGGLTLALMLHRAGVGCRVYEAAPEIKPIGVGINILPHATRELSALGLEPALARVGVTTADACFFNRFGQLIYSEALGRHAGVLAMNRAHDLQRGALVESLRAWIALLCTALFPGGRGHRPIIANPR